MEVSPVRVHLVGERLPPHPDTTMSLRRAFFRTALLPAFVLAASLGAQSAKLPDRLSDAEFWKLTTDISEPDQYFRIVDNFTSNEMEVGQLYTALRAGKFGGDVYIGV